MYTLVKSLLIFIVLIILHDTCNSQAFPDIKSKVKKSSKYCYILENNGEAKDTICLEPLFDNFIVPKDEIKHVSHKIIIIEWRLKCPDVHCGFIKIEQWDIVDKRFVLTSTTKIPLQGCRGIGTTKLRVRKNGIKWHYRTRFLKSEKGFLTFEELRKNNELSLPCH